MEAALKEYNNESDPVKKKIIRDRTIVGYVLSADEKYDEFTTNISRELRGTNISLDLLTGALGALGSVITDAAPELAAGAAFTAGAKSSISKEVYLERAVPALLTAMDAARLKVLTSIQLGMRLSADEYPLEAAFPALRAYERAGNINRALSDLTAQAGLALAQERQDYRDAIESCDPASDIRPYTARATNFLAALNRAAENGSLATDPERDAKLDRLASAMRELGLKPDAKANSADEVFSQIGAIQVARNKACKIEDVKRLTEVLTGTTGDN